MDLIDRNFLADANADGTYHYRLGDFDAANIHGRIAVEHSQLQSMGGIGMLIKTYNNRYTVLNTQAVTPLTGTSRLRTKSWLSNPADIDLTFMFVSTLYLLVDGVVPVMQAEMPVV